MKTITFIIFLLLFTEISQAQVDFKQVVPPSPNVASLFKSVVTPVNEYSGLPNISIPLCNISEGEINMPLSLSYNTGGIQVSEEAGVVGLGWSLIAGGAISRSVNGVDDFDTTYGYLYHTHQGPDISVINPDIPPFVEADENCTFPVNGNLTYFSPPIGEAKDHDYMPDIFHYNFNGYSGSFMFQPNGEKFLLEKAGLKIELEGTPPLNMTFKITTEDGIVYNFGLSEKTSFPNGNLDAYTSSWFLTSITDTNGNEVFLDYKTLNDSSQALTTRPLPSFTQSFETPTYSGPDNPNQNGRTYYNSRGPQTIIDDYYLNKITFDSGEVIFNYSADGQRSDLNGYYLESLILKNNENKEVKHYNFDYSYFGNLFGHNSQNYNSVSIGNGDYAQTIGALESYYPDINLRLRLDGITENQIQSHRFDYYGTNIPPNKTSLSQDYWGFFNNAPNFETFIPELRDSIGNPLEYAQFTKADRLPRENFAKYFSLKKITYPTKGSSEYDYELNTYNPEGTHTNPYPATVQKYVPVYANETNVFASDTIVPNHNATLYMDYEVTLRGWDSQYSKPMLSTDNFQNKFYLVFKDLNGTILSKQNIPSDEGNLQWGNFTEQQNSSGQAVIAYSFSEKWEYNNPIPYYDLTDNMYIIEAHFDDLGGKLYGQATVKARWEDVVVDNTKQYSIGGGLRVKSIIDRDWNGSVASKRNYNYHYLDTIDNVVVEKSYGKIKTLPKYSEDRRTVYMMKYLFTIGLESYYDIQSLPKIAGSASSQNIFSKDAGSYVGYDQVAIAYEGADGDNGMTIKKYFNEEDYPSMGSDSIPYEDDYYKYPPIRMPYNGYLKKTENYKRDSENNYIRVSETENHYKINGLEASGFNIYNLYQNFDRLLSSVKERPITLYIEGGAHVVDCSSFKFQYHTFFSNLIQQTGQLETIYDPNGENSVITQQDFYYDNDSIPTQRTRTKETESDGAVVETRIFFPDDITSSGSLQEGGVLQSYELVKRLKEGDLHRISTPVQKVVKRNNVVLSIERTEFASFDSIILPSKMLTAKGPTLQDRLVYEDYKGGRPIQLRMKDGIPISYIWGYNGTYPIAKIENASYSDLEAALGINTGKLKSYDETNLSNINGLRITNPEFMVTTYTYDPLVGVTSVTDFRGYKTEYFYDSDNRLKEVRDKDGHLVTDYEYNYKGQAQP